MKVVIAPDSFKESLSAADAAAAMADGVAAVYPNADILRLPMADGGEGTVDAILAARKQSPRFSTITGALSESRTAKWGLLPNNTAVIEVAEAAGLAHFPETERDVRRACSGGVGDLILAALDAGATHIVLGLGGSSTNDGGAGLIRRLGATLTDSAGAPLPPGGAALARLAHVDLSGLDPRLATLSITLASDVDNPLCGAKGASRVFGPQKGASDDDVTALDAALAHYAGVVEAALNTNKPLRDAPGAGAAGGIGFAAHAVLGATFRPGVEIVAEINGLAQAVAGADLVFTGEGRMDYQTLHGKTPVGVARVAQKAGVPVIALVGGLGDDYQAVYAAGITAAFSLSPAPMTLARAMSEAGTHMRERTTDIMRLWQAAQPAP